MPDQAHLPALVDAQSDVPLTEEKVCASLVTAWQTVRISANG